MARVIGYLHGVEVFNKECAQADVDEYIQDAFNSWGRIDDIGGISVEVTDNDGGKWSPN